MQAAASTAAIIQFAAVDMPIDDVIAGVSMQKTKKQP